MATDGRILTDDMIAGIQAHLERYPSRQAVTLPALHIVNQQLRHVPLQAVVEIAELRGRDEIKNELRSNTEEAVARGAFGAPTFFLGDELFFGADHLFFVERALA